MQTLFLIKSIFLFFSIVIQQAHCASNQSHLGALAIGDQQIPAYVNVNMLGDYKGKKTENATLQSANFHQKYIIPRQEFFKITHAPIVCYDSEYNSQAFIPNYQTTNLQTIEIENQHKKFKNFIINHEMVHLYLHHTYDNTYFDFKQYFYWNFKLFFLSSLTCFMYEKIYPILLSSRPQYKLAFVLTALGLLECSILHGFLSLIALFLSHRKNYYRRVEEFFCDAKGITYGSKDQQLSTIQNGINYFQKPEEKFTVKTKTLFWFFGYTHPPDTERIKQLEKLKKLVDENKKDKFESYLKKQEMILKNYYESFLTNPERWIKIRLMNLKNRLWKKTSQEIKT